MRSYHVCSEAAVIIDKDTISYEMNVHCIRLGQLLTRNWSRETVHCVVSKWDFNLYLIVTV